MTRKLSLLIAAVAAMAFAVPSTAGAVEATCPAGTRCPVGTQITMTGKDIALTSSLLGTKTCVTLNLNVALAKNDGTSVEASGQNSNPTRSNCRGGSTPFVVTTFNVAKLFSNVTGSGAMSFTTTLDTESGLKCTYTGTNVPFTYATGSDLIKFSNASGVTGSSGCGTAKLDGEFTFEKQGTTSAVILD